MQTLSLLWKGNRDGYLHSACPTFRGQQDYKPEAFTLTPTSKNQELPVQALITPHPQPGFIPGFLPSLQAALS